MVKRLLHIVNEWTPYWVARERLERSRCGGRNGRSGLYVWKEQRTAARRAFRATNLGQSRERWTEAFGQFLDDAAELAWFDARHPDAVKRLSQLVEAARRAWSKRRG